jgi:hypothetical protein
MRHSRFRCLRVEGGQQLLIGWRLPYRIACVSAFGAVGSAAASRRSIISSWIAQRVLSRSQHLVPEPREVRGLLAQMDSPSIGIAEARGLWSTPSLFGREACEVWSKSLPVLPVVCRQVDEGDLLKITTVVFVRPVESSASLRTREQKSPYGLCLIRKDVPSDDAIGTSAQPRLVRLHLRPRSRS